MPSGPAIALIDGEHLPAAVRDALDQLEARRPLAGVVFCGGEEKVRPGVLDAPQEHYGRRVTSGEEPATAIRRLAARTGAGTVVDLADEPVLGPEARQRLAALALHLGLDYQAPGLHLEPPRYAQLAFRGPKLAVIATGKRAGKTAVAGHWAALLADRGVRPVIVSMGRGGPAEPALAEAGTTLEDLVELAAAGRHAASDYLEDAALAGVPAIGCRRVGGGPAGEPFESNVPEGAALAASLRPEAIVFEGSGACIPPVEVDRTVCLIADAVAALGQLGAYRLLRADLTLTAEPMPAEDRRAVARLAPGPVVRFRLEAEAVEALPPGARVAVFSTSTAPVTGVEPVVASGNLARRAALERDLDRAAAEGCDVYLTELKAAAIDTVAARARAAGARVVFIRNRPVGVEADLDRELVDLFERA